MLAAGAAVSAPVKDRHVEAELVPALRAVVPGEPLTVALRLRHDPGWHTYWQSSSTGYPTTLEWDLPDGWRAGEIRWPTPRTYLSDFIIDYVYEGEVLLPVTIFPPAGLEVGSEVTLSARADWLMCEKVCIPGSAKLSLTLPVGDDHEPHPVWGSALRHSLDRLPAKVDAWELAAYSHGGSLWLSLRAPPGHSIPGGLYFFSDNALTEPDLAVQVEESGPGAVLLTFSRSPHGPAGASRLTGVLRADPGWEPGGGIPGILVDVPILDGPPPGGVVLAPLASSSPFWMLLLLGAAGGLILNLMPCVFPVIGLKIMGFVGQAGQTRAAVFGHGLVYTLGVLASFWTLAALLLILRAGGEQLGWGFQLQNPVFVLLLSAVLFLFALNLSGVFEVGLSAVGIGSGLASKQGLSGSFFSGVLATVVATPCAAPFLAPALGAALTLEPVPSLLLFSTIALGLASPYLLLSVFPQLVRALPPPGSWMETFKQVMAFPLYGTLAYLLWVLIGQLEENSHGAHAMLWVLLGLVLIALAAYIYGRWSGFDRRPGVRWGARVSAAAILLLALWMAWPRPLAERSSPQVPWEDWSPERVSMALSEGRPVYVDFTARWCATCQTNKAAVFSSSEVVQHFLSHEVLALRADWTNRNPLITQELARYGRSAVPFNLVFHPSQDRAIVLPEILTPGIVLDALRK